jgi:NADPH2:quinone reductase
MKAVRIHNFGSTAEVLQYEEVPIPEPGPNEFLIKVEAASLNRVDLALRKGTYRIAPEELPVIPGREFAGTVAKLGAGNSGIHGWPASSGMHRHGRLRRVRAR